MTGGRCLAGVAGVGLAVLTIAACRSDADVSLADPLPEVFLQQAQEEGLTRRETSGKRLFAHHCATCHGDSGAGDGQNAYTLNPAPPDLGESLDSHPPSYWRQIIERGSASVGRSPLCPPWDRSITPDDVGALVAYLQTLIPPDQADTPGNEESSAGSSP